MENHYKQDIANNIIGLISLRERMDPRRKDDAMFKSYFKNTLVPNFAKAYGVKLRYGNHANILKQIQKVS
jgi:hypothetical protein